MPEFMIVLARKPQWISTACRFFACVSPFHSSKSAPATVQLNSIAQVKQNDQQQKYRNIIPKKWMAHLAPDFRLDVNFFAKAKQSNCTNSGSSFLEPCWSYTATGTRRDMSNQELNFPLQHDLTQKPKPKPSHILPDFVGPFLSTMSPDLS